DARAPDRIQAFADAGLRLHVDCGRCQDGRLERLAPNNFTRLAVEGKDVPVAGADVHLVPVHRWATDDAIRQRPVPDRPPGGRVAAKDRAGHRFPVEGECPVPRGEDDVVARDSGRAPGGVLDWLRPNLLPGPQIDTENAIILRSFAGAAPGVR